MSCSSAIGAMPAALALGVLALSATQARADFVVRDPTGKRVEVIEERTGGVLIRRDPRGRRLGVMEPGAGGFVLRDERGRRVGVAQGGGQGLETGVVRDPRGRRVGTIHRR